MRHYVKGILFLLVNLCSLLANSQASKGSSPFRIVGYYSLQAAMIDSVTTVPFDQLTHINLWFLNPDSLGNFTQDFALLRPFADAAHEKKVKVLVSIGGGSPHPFYHALLKEDKRKFLIDNLVTIVDEYRLDGVDVDLEGTDIDENYEVFVKELAAALHARKKLITAAVAVYYKDAVSAKALAQYDFVNIMSYDRTGPWRPENPGPHSTYAHAVEDIDFFANVEKLPKGKMNLGVPFYGYGFGPNLNSTTISMNYGEIVAQFPDAEASDEQKTSDGKTIYYNGIETIKKKTALAKEKASGIMIWQIKGDAQGELSLLKAINEAVSKKQ